MPDSRQYFERGLLTPQFPIDFVYTWVDSADPDFLAMLHDYRGPAEDEHRSGESRFRCHEELRYSLRSVAAYAPWVRHIFIVTNGQRPVWLAETPNVSIVTHEQIIEPEYLPTFNSHVIESALHRIPGLSEHYVYFNDDVMLLRPMQKEDFFTANGLMFGLLSKDRLPAGPPAEDELPSVSAAKNSTAPLYRQWGSWLDRRYKHTFHPQRKSVAADNEQYFQQEYAAFRRNRFRATNDLVTCTYLNPGTAYLTGRGLLRWNPTRYVSVRGNDAEEAYRRLLEEKGTPSAADSVCLNDAPETDPAPDYDARLRAFLADYYPNPSPFECDSTDLAAKPEDDTLLGLAHRAEETQIGIRNINSFEDVLARTYDRSMQIGPAQLQAIAGAIYTRRPGCNLLIFGCGNDSSLWAALNAAGRTVFMETSPEWRTRILSAHPDLDIRLYEPAPGRCVAKSLAELRDPEEPIPAGLSDERWDVILIDGPRGWHPEQPGRAAEIAWTAKLKDRHTHIFIDDYDRPLERAYADLFHGRGERSVLPNKSKQMLWVAGRPAPISLGTELVPVTAERANRKGCLIFLLDRNYLLPLKVFAYSIRAALEATKRDIVVVTNDNVVTADKFVSGLADRVIQLSDRETEEIAKAKRDLVRPEARHDQLGKYTFLKFLCFGDLGYRDHVFFDTDMLCIDGDFRLSELETDADFGAALTIGAHRLGIQHLAYHPHGGSDDLPSEIRLQIKERYLKIATTRRKAINSFNSGVFFAGPRILSSLTRQRMIETATRFSFEFEQQVSLAVLSDTEGLRWTNFPISVNAPILPLYAMGRNHFDEVREHVRLIHYNGSRRPWQVDRGNADWLEKLWWDTHDDALAWAASIERSGLKCSARIASG